MPDVHHKPALQFPLQHSVFASPQRGGGAGGVTGGFAGGAGGFPETHVYVSFGFKPLLQLGWPPGC